MSASGRNDFPCPVCKSERKRASFDDCKHSWADIHHLEGDNHIRKIVRDELKRAGLV